MFILLVTPVTSGNITFSDHQVEVTFKLSPNFTTDYPLSKFPQNT